MKADKIKLFVLSMLACATSALAKGASPAVPVASPGDWVVSDDYPSAALHLHMAGTTAFKLIVDTTGKPIRCDIVASSKFDVLDAATCDSVMPKARFFAARNGAGQPVEGSFTGKVRWVEPTGATTPVIERLGSMFLSIDQTGKVASCRFVFHFPVEGGTPSQNPCEHELKSPPPALGLELRGHFQGPLASVEIEMADVFTPTLLARVLAPMPGYEQRGLYIHNFTVTRDSKLAKCTFAEQRGSIILAQDFCVQAQQESFDPPFAAIDKDGIASGSHVVRILLKLANN